jgi:hypothetical protein
MNGRAASSDSVELTRISGHWWLTAPYGVGISLPVQVQLGPRNHPEGDPPRIIVRSSRGAKNKPAGRSF